MTITSKTITKKHINLGSCYHYCLLLPLKYFPDMEGCSVVDKDGENDCSWMYYVGHVVIKHLVYRAFLCYRLLNRWRRRRNNLFINIFITIGYILVCEIIIHSHLVVAHFQRYHILTHFNHMFVCKVDISICKNLGKKESVWKFISIFPMSYHVL